MDEQIVKEKRSASELIKGMSADAAWFQKQARYHAHKASHALLGTTHISHLVEQLACEQTYNKLTQWVITLQENLVDDKSPTD